VATLLAPRLAWAWVLLAATVALGRIGATAHFVADTVAGLWLGALGATLVSWALARRAEAIERRLGLPRCVG
jgi:membrane-associated phospholipid phosphatase